MNPEKQYTSTATKIFDYLDRLKLIREKNEWHPISLQIAPTEICNLNCDFCSVKNRGNRSLEYHDIIEALVKFKKLGIKSLEITGGGDPTLYPKINELIILADELNLKIGMITNGLVLDKVKEYVLDKLSWLRISLNGLDYGKLPKVPSDFAGTLGFSYVWNDKSSNQTLKYIHENYSYQAKYIRIVPDCLYPEKQIILRDEVAKLIKNHDYKEMFAQTKDYSIHDNCMIGGLKPFLYTDGYVYQCSATALYNRAFSPEWRICHMTEINQIWPHNYHFRDNSMCEKGKCFYADQNKILDILTQKVEENGFI